MGRRGRTTSRPARRGDLLRAGPRTARGSAWAIVPSRPWGWPRRARPGRASAPSTRGVTRRDPISLRDEAAERAALLTVLVVCRGPRPDNIPQKPSSQTRARFSCTSPGSVTFIDLVAPSVSSITPNGTVPGPGDPLRRRANPTPAPCGRQRTRRRRDLCLREHRRGLHRPVDPVDGESILPHAVRGPRQPARVHRLRAAGSRPSSRSPSPGRTTCRSSPTARRRPPRLSGRWRPGASPHPRLPSYHPHRRRAPRRGPRRGRDARRTIPSGVLSSIDDSASRC